MFTIIQGRGEAETDESYQHRAEVCFANAQIILRGGLPAAREYAYEWFQHFRPALRRGETQKSRALQRELMAQDALACALNITHDGRAHYWTDDGQLVCCTLLRDAAAGPVGYYSATTMRVRRG
jgi:hypothetical protein